MENKKMENKMPENKLEKISNNKFRLTTKFDKLHRVDEFDKDFLKQSYNEGVQEYNKLIEQLSKINKDIEEMTLTKEEEDEIIRFIEMNNKAHQYGKYKKAMEQRDTALDMLKRLRTQKEDIEKVIPELKRKKK